MSLHYITSKRGALAYFEQLWESGKRSFDELAFEEKAHLTGLLMDEAGDAFDFIAQTLTADDVAHSLAAYLKSFTNCDLDDYKEAQRNILKDLSTGAVLFAKHRIEALFEQQHTLEHSLDHFEKGIRHDYALGSI